MFALDDFNVQSDTEASIMLEVVNSSYASLLVLKEKERWNAALRR